MAEGTPSPFPSERHRSDDAPRGERSPGAREGGFRIRLSDNEMRSARALQEAFGLRSTVAVLGFALRALGQQLEEGKLDELIAQHRAQAPARSQGEGGRSEGRRDRSEGRGGRGQDSRGSAGGGRSARVDPFARPPRPEAAPEPAPEEATPEPTDEAELPAAPDGAADAQDVAVSSEPTPEEPAADPAPEPSAAPVTADEGAEG